jgi:hypothetical protein
MISSHLDVLIVLRGQQVGPRRHVVVAVAENRECWKKRVPLTLSSETLIQHYSILRKHSTTADPRLCTASHL